MFCYKDMTFCTFYEDCANAQICHRTLTPKVSAEAKGWWGDAGEPPIAVFLEKPSCHMPILPDALEIARRNTIRRAA
jgi:hypothetical protein